MNPELEVDKRRNSGSTLSTAALNDSLNSITSVKDLLVVHSTKKGAKDDKVDTSTASWHDSLEDFMDGDEFLKNDTSFVNVFREEANSTATQSSRRHRTNKQKRRASVPQSQNVQDTSKTGSQKKREKKTHRRRSSHSLGALESVPFADDDFKREVQWRKSRRDKDALFAPGPGRAAPIAVNGNDEAQQFPCAQVKESLSKRELSKLSLPVLSPHTLEQTYWYRPPRVDSDMKQIHSVECQRIVREAHSFVLQMIEKHKCDFEDSTLRNDDSNSD